MQARSESADFAKSRDRDGAPGAAARGTRRARSAAQTLPGQMVFIELWETFYSEAEKLYEEHPAHTRYVMKYRHVDGKLELKVTNDRVCLKYLTDQHQDLKRIEKLNNLFLTRMCGKDPAQELAPAAAETESPHIRPVSGEEVEKVGSASKKKRRK